MEKPLSEGRSVNRASIKSRPPASPICLGVRLLAFPLGWIVGRLPQRAVTGLGVLLTWLAWPFIRQRRRIAARNLELCFPQLDARTHARWVRETVTAAVTGVLESLRAWFSPAQQLAGLAHVEGLEHLRAALAGGHGAILLASHFTTIEIASRLLSEALGEPVHMVVRQHSNACLEALIDQRRRRYCGTTIEKKDLSRLLRSLRDNRAVAYAADQNFSYRSAFVPFFGILAATLVATSRIARKSGAPVLPAWFVREADRRYRIVIEPPWPDYPTQDAVADAARFMAAVEERARQHPTQYLWVHRRFKTRPPGEPSLYD